MWLTLVCVLFDFYWIHIKICGESVPLDQNRNKLRGPEGFTKIGKALRASFFSVKGVFKRVTQNNEKRRWANGKKKCSLCPRTSRVNQNWFTILDQNRKSESNLIHSHTAPNAPCVEQTSGIAHGYQQQEKTAVWDVSGAVWRREPYNLTLESKTYYTQNYDIMR